MHISIGGTIIYSELKYFFLILQWPILLSHTAHFGPRRILKGLRLQKFVTYTVAQEE